MVVLDRSGLDVGLILASPPWRRPFKLDPFTFFFICSYFDEASFRIIIYFEHVLTVIQNRIVWQSGNDFEKREHKKLLERKPDHRMDSEAAGIDTTLRQWRTVANGGCEEVTEGGLGAKGKGDSNVLSSGVRSSVCSAKKPCDTGGARCPGLGACSTQAFIHLSRNQASWILVSKPGRNIQGEKKKLPGFTGNRKAFALACLDLQSEKLSDRYVFLIIRGMQGV